MSDTLALLHLYRAALLYPQKSSVFAWRSMFKLFTWDVTCSPNHFVYSFMKTSATLVTSEFQNFVAGTLNLGSELHPHPHANTRACTCTSVPTCRAADAKVMHSFTNVPAMCRCARALTSRHATASAPTYPRSPRANAPMCTCLTHTCTP